jgi:hypothetical protein
MITCRRLQEQTSERHKLLASQIHASERAIVQVHAGLDKIKRDYTTGDLPATDYLELKQSLESELQGAEAELERLRASQDLEGHEDAESEVLERLATVRELIGGSDLDAIRVALAASFERFEINVDGEQGKITAVMKPAAIKTVDEELRPVLRPSALPLADYSGFGSAKK